MPRVVALECQGCRRKFGGDQTERRHRVVAGDRFRCRSDAELREAGMWQDRAGVWHRGENPNQQVLTLSDTAPANTAPRVLARTSDPSTSARAAKAISPRTGTLKALLLSVYRDAPEGLTDEEAGLRAGISLYSATKRCADLRRDGWIVPSGERKGSSGQARQVCRVAEAVAS